MKNTIRNIGRKALIGMLALSATFGGLEMKAGAQDISIDGKRVSINQAEEELNLYKTANPEKAKNVAKEVVKLYEDGKIDGGSYGVITSAKAYDLLGDSKRAIDVYEKAIKNAKYADYFLYGLTELYLNHGEKAKARETYGKVKQRDSSLDSRIYGAEQTELLKDFSKTIKSIGGAIK